MQITLYLAYNDEYLKYFTSFFDGKNEPVHISECFMGYCLESELSESDIYNLSAAVSRFIIEFYLKEAILSKVYDEYIDLDINDAVILLSEMSEKVCETEVYRKILDILKGGGRLCVDSFIIFNIKPIMQNIYEKVDFLAENVLLQKERDAFIAMLKTYCTLNSRKCHDALVEFSKEDMCRVALDNCEAQTVNHDKLLTILTEYSPENIVLKNPDYCPEISGLLRDIFRERVCEK